MFQLCRYILASNQQCAQPALNGGKFCRHHREVKAWKCASVFGIAPTTQTYDHGTMLVPAPRVQPSLQLEFPEDRASIQINLFRIADYLARGLMDRSTATALMYGMQVAQTNLGKMPLLEAAPAPQSRSRSNYDEDSDTTCSDSSLPVAPVSRTVFRVILTPDGDEIAPPVEILEPNEAEPIHHKGCPCLLCAEKYRNQPPEEHHPACQCGLCEEDEGTGLRERSRAQGTGLREPGSTTTPTDVILSGATATGVPTDRSSSVGWEGSAVEGPAVPQSSTTQPAGDNASTTALPPAPYPLHPKRIARASALLSGSTSRDPLNRPWSIAEYTFGDTVRRHEAQYAARAAACLAAGIEPPPYEPYITGLIRPGTPEWEEDQQMQQHSSEYWAAHFRNQIAERPDLQQALDEEERSE